MDAREYLIIVAIECRKHKTCYDCPFFGVKCTPIEFSHVAGKNLDEEIAKTIAKAYDCNHVKTYADDFFEKNPEAPREEDGTPKVCREHVYGTKCPAKGFGDGVCYQCWNEPVPESEKMK